MKCETHGRETNAHGFCRVCVAYNAAVEAQHAAAEEFALGHLGRSSQPWLNEFGAFARDADGVVVQIATPAEVAPFVALTQAAIRAAEGET